MNNIKFGKFLQNERKSRGISQEELAKMTGFTKRAIQYWESGERSITLEHADIITKALDTTFCIGTKKGGETE